MARRKRRRIVEESEVDEVPMTPMIDIVFQLLIFFMLTMQFKEVEGKLLSQLPKDKGLAPSHVIQPEFEEVRIVLCAGGATPQEKYADWQSHISNKGAHEKLDKPNAECIALVGKKDQGMLYKTADKPNMLKNNEEVYQRIGQEVKSLYELTPSTKDPAQRAPVILDADSEVPYEHIIGAVNACKSNGIDNIEFVGNPRHERYYGSGQKGQFKRN